MGIPFDKVQGLGNHFVLVDERRTGPRNWREFAIATGAPRTGVGSDGLLVVTQPSIAGAQARMVMYNPDGTEDMCGNGARCVAHWEAVRCPGLREFVLETAAGPLDALVLDPDPRHGRASLTMGEPVFDPKRMPALLDGDRVLERDLSFGGWRYPVSLAFFGTPICAIFGDLPDRETFLNASQALQRAPEFPESVNVLWVEPTGPHSLRALIYERGAGETQACGTGACGSTVCGILTGRVLSPVDVEMPGGTLRIDWEGPGSQVRQTGEAGIVFSGDWPGPG